MATKGRSTGSRGGRTGSVSLADADREYINESLSSARGRVGTAAEVDEGGLFEALERFGLSSARVERLREAIADVDVRESVDKASEYLAEQIENARDYTKENPGKVIGGAAGVLVGASLLALAIRRAAGEEKKSRSTSASTTSSTSRSTSAKKAAAGRKGGKASGGSKKRSSSSSGASSKRSSGSSTSSRKSSGSKKASKRR